MATPIDTSNITLRPDQHYHNGRIGINIRSIELEIIEEQVTPVVIGSISMADGTMRDIRWTAEDVLRGIHQHSMMEIPF